MMASNFNTIETIDIFKEDCKFHHVGLSVKSITSLLPHVKTNFRSHSKGKSSIYKSSWINYRTIRALR